MRKIGLLFVVALALSLGAAPAVDFNTRACLTSRSEIFVSGMQRWVTMKQSNTGTDRADETRYNPTAVALGYQYRTDQITAGLTTSYEWGNAKYDFVDEYAKVRDRTWGFTLSGEYRFGDGYYAKGSAFVGFADQKVKDGYRRTTRYGSDGSVDSTRFAASIELGKRFELGNGLRFTPHAGFDYAHVPGKDIPFMNGNTHDDSPWPNQNFYEIPLGVTFAKDFAVCDWVITPSVDLTLVTSVGHIKNRNMNGRAGFASLTGSDGSAWKVYGIGAENWGGRATAGVKAVKSERFDLDFNYTYEGRKKYYDHRLTASVGWSF